MADKKEEGNILSSMVSGVMLQIKPFTPNGSPNGKSGGKEEAAVKSAHAEIEERAQEKMTGGMIRYDALVAATEEVHKERTQRIIEKFEASAKKEEKLPRTGLFRWLRRNGNGGEAAKKQAPPLAMKK